MQQCGIITTEAVTLEFGEGKREKETRGWGSNSEDLLVDDDGRLHADNTT